MNGASLQAFLSINKGLFARGHMTRAVVLISYSPVVLAYWRSILRSSNPLPLYDDCGDQETIKGAKNEVSLKKICPTPGPCRVYP
jgi:hypothetical protein